MMGNFTYTIENNAMNFNTAITHFEQLSTQQFYKFVYWVQCKHIDGYQGDT